MATQFNADDSLVLENLVSRILRGGNTLFVSKTGNDSNNGTYDSPKLTVQSAITASAANGTIRIGDGTYTEEIDTSDKLLHFIGQSKVATIITYQDPTFVTMKVRGGSSVRNMTVSATVTSGTKDGLWFQGGIGGGTVEDCIISAQDEGLHFWGSEDAAAPDGIAIVRRSQLISTLWALCIGECKKFMVEDTDIFGPGDSGSAAVVMIQNSAGTFRNTSIRSMSSAAGLVQNVALSLRGGAKVVLDNCFIEASNSNVSNSTPVIAIDMGASVADNGDIPVELSMRNTTLRSSSAGGGTTQDIYPLTGHPTDGYTTISESGCTFDRTKCTPVPIGALKPTVAQRPVDVATTGEVGMDLSNTKAGTDWITSTGLAASAATEIANAVLATGATEATLVKILELLRTGR